MQKLEPTIQGALDKKMFDVSMQLAEYCEDPDQMKKDIWYRQGKIFQAELKYQEAEHAFMTAGKPMDALQMYIDCKKWADAEKVVNNMPMGDNKDKAVKMIKLGRAQAMVQEGRYKEAETIYAEMGDIETMVSLYKDKQMYQEAMQFAKAHDRRDLINEVQQSLADRSDAAQRNNYKQKTVTAADTLSQTLAEKQLEQKMNNQQEIVIQAVGLRNQLVQACKAGGETFLNYLLKHAVELCMPVIEGKVDEAKLADDIVIMQNIIQFSSDISAEEKSVTLALYYVTKGIPQSLINENDKSKNCISPIISPLVDKQSLLVIMKAVLGIEYTEEDYMKRVLQSEVTKDGIYSRARQMLLNYRAALMATPKGQQAFKANMACIIPGEPDLSRCFEACHLIVQSAYTLSLPNSPQ